MHHKLIQSQHRKSRVAAAEGLFVFPGAFFGIRKTGCSFWDKLGEFFGIRKLVFQYLGLNSARSTYVSYSGRAVI